MREDEFLNKSNLYSAEQFQLKTNQNIGEDIDKTEERELVYTSTQDKLSLSNYNSQTKSNAENSTSNTKMLEDKSKQVEENDSSETSSLGDNQDKTKKEIQKKEKMSVHVNYGNRLIECLGLRYFNNNIYFYQDGVYKVVKDIDLSSAILRYINPATEPAVCKKVIFYVKNMLYNNETIQINTNYLNFKNCLYDLDNQMAMEHTPNVFTVNQIAIDYNPALPANAEVENFLDDISNHNMQRKKGILQVIGYLLTSKNNIQKIIIIYGPAASNGKSTLLKIIERIVGSENVCHKSMEEFDKDFGADGMEFKQLNISTELPQTRVKNISILKKTVTGDTFEAKVKFEKNKTIMDTYIKHLYATNFLPNVADTSNGYYRRLHIILLDNVFNSETSTFNLDNFCSQQNLNYLGNLAFKEYLEMTNSGILEFANSEESKKILEEYRVENDTILSFLTDTDIIKTIYNCDIKRELMYKLYRTHCQLNALTPITKNLFYRELREKYQFEERHKNGNTEIVFYREFPVARK